MQLKTIIIFLVKNRATFMFTTSNFIKKQASYKIWESKMKNMASRLFLIFQIQIFQYFINTCFGHNKQMRACPNGFQHARSTLCHVYHPSGLGFKPPMDHFFQTFHIFFIFLTNFNIFFNQSKLLILR